MFDFIINSLNFSFIHYLENLMEVLITNSFIDSYINLFLYPITDYFITLFINLIISCFGKNNCSLD